MNFNLFDDMDGVVLRERENSPNKQNNKTSESSSGNMTAFPQQTPLAMAYVPFQQWENVYQEDEAFSKGTLFPNLDFPFEGGGGSDE